MGKNIGAAVVGYVVMVAAVFGGMSLGWLLLGADRAFQPGSWDVSMLWSVIMMAVGLVAAVAGGMVCARLGTGRTPIYMLVGLIVVLGIASALPDAGVAETVRSSDISLWDAMSTVRPPALDRWSNPIIGVVGVLLGASRVQKGSEAA
jgi:hypothetical protein